MFKFIFVAAILVGSSGFAQANPLNAAAASSAKNSGVAAKKACLAKDPKMRGDALRQCMKAEKAKK